MTIMSTPTSRNQQQKEYLSIQSELLNLKDDYTCLYDKYSKLLQETSENTVLQSMNDMKIQYQELLRNMVSKDKYEDLLIEYQKLYSTIHGLKILIQNVNKHVNTNDTVIYSRIKIIKEILNDTIKFHREVSEVHTFE